MALFPYELWYRRLEQLTKANGWADQPWLKASTALIVGVLSFFAVLHDSRDWKPAACVTGMVLPALFSFALGQRGS